MIRALLFDVDGTLLDSVNLHALCWQDALEHFGHRLPFELVRRQIGKGGDQLLPIFLTPEQRERYGEELNEYRGKLWKSEFMRLVRPFPKTRELFQRMRDDGKKLVLASSSKKDELEYYANLCGVSDLIESGTSADDADKSKPHPDIFMAAMKRVPGVTPTEAIAVGDTPWDVIAAARTGLRTIGMLCGGWTRASLLAAGCVELYASPEDMLQRYDRSLLHEVGERAA